MRFRDPAIFLILFLIFFCNWAHSQSFSGHPPKQNWQEIKTNTFRLIFPAEIKEQANRSANIINKLLEQNNTVGKKVKFTNIVFQNKTTISNGYVGYGPYRSEFFCTPTSSPYSLGAISWMDALTIHEYRHVLQLSNTLRGVTKLTSLLFGDYAWAIISNINIPDWYYEGDAVMAETALTEGGRGRVPAFSLTQRALFNQNIQYSFLKTRNGSLKSMVPSHYPLGYVQINYLRNKYGINVWKDVLSNSSKYKGIFYSFSRNLKKKTGLSTKDLYKISYDSLRINHYKKIEKTKAIDDLKLKTSPLKNTVTNYVFPQINSKGQLFCLKSSYKEAPKIIKVNPNGSEEKIVSLGYGENGYFSCKNDLFVWTERRPDPRWANQNYSVLVTYNLATKKRETITKKTKLFSPEFSNDEKKIAAVEALPNHQFTIKIIDKITGKDLQNLPNPNKYYFYYPKWSNNDRRIVAVAQDSLGKFGIVEYDLTTKQINILIDFSHHIIAHLSVSNMNVFFSSSFNGIDNIYGYNSVTKDVTQYTNSKLGAFFPSASGSTMVYSSFDHMGYYLSATNIDSFYKEKVKIPLLGDNTDFKTRSILNEGGNVLDNISFEENKVKKYKRWKHPINIHSYYPTVDRTKFNYSIISENVLSTIRGSATYQINRYDYSSAIIGNIAYGGLFPILDFNVNKIRYRRMYNPSNNGFDTIRWDESIFRSGFNIPLDYSKGAFSTKLTLFSSMAYHLLNYKTEEGNQKLTSVKAGFSFSNVLRRAKQNVGAKFAQLFSFNLESGLNQSVQTITLSTRLYFPGLFINHSLNFLGTAKFEKRSATYRLLDQFYYARGFTSPKNYQNILKASFNYQLPLLYPDLGFAGLFYFKRIRANFFGDYSVINFNSANPQEFKSMGIELFFDTHIFNLITFSWGVRESILLDSDPNLINRKHFPDLILNIPF